MESENKLLLLKKHIKDEISLFKGFLELEDCLSGSVKDKNWESVNELLKSLGEISARVEKTEKLRNEAYNKLLKDYKLPEKTGFKSFLNHLPENEKKELDTLYKDLTIITKEVKKVSIGMSSHFKYICSTVNQLLEEVFPFRKGKIYSRQGKASEASSGPVVINKQL